VVNTTSKALTVALFVLLVSMQYQLWRGPSGLCQLFEIKRQIATADDQNAGLAKRNAVLAADVADLREGDEAIEEHARTVLGMIKNNETFYQVIE
jgi:cell division protein FtsB